MSTLSLPPGWSQMQHDMGVPFYLHKESNVVSWYKPYTITNTNNSATHTPPTNWTHLGSVEEIITNLYNKTQQAFENHPLHMVNYIIYYISVLVKEKKRDISSSFG